MTFSRRLCLRPAEFFAERIEWHRQTAEIGIFLFCARVECDAVAHEMQCTHLVHIRRLIVLEIDAVQFVEKQMQFIAMTTEIGGRVVTNGDEILNRFENRIVRYHWWRWIHDGRCVPAIDSHSLHATRDSNQFCPLQLCTCDASFDARHSLLRPHNMLLGTDCQGSCHSVAFDTLTHTTQLHEKLLPP